MAKARTRTTTRTVQPIVVQTPRAITRRSSGGGRRRSRRGKRRSSSKSSGGATLKNRMIGAGIGGFGVGFIEKNWGDKIPAIPIVGRKGAIALAAYWLAPRHSIIVDVGIAAAAIAGYEFGKEGRVTGEDDDDLIAAQT